MALIPTTQKKPWIPAPGVAQVQMVYSSQGQKCENVYHVLVHSDGSAVTEAQMDALEQVFENWQSTQMRQQQVNNTALTQIVIRDLTTQSGLVKEYTPVSPVQGTRTVPAAPGNVTIAVRWSTGRGGRSFRGRTYHIGMSVNDVNVNTMDNATRLGLVAVYAGLMTAVAASAGQHLAVVSYAANKFWRSTAVSTPITGASIDPNLDSQRRRLAGRGT